MEGERRYWVNAPFGSPDLFDIEDFEDGEERGGLKRIDAELGRACFFIGETDWIYKIWDKEEAIEMANIALRTMQIRFLSQLSLYVQNVENLEGSVMNIVVSVELSYYQKPI